MSTKKRKKRRKKKASTSVDTNTTSNTTNSSTTRSKHKTKQTLSKKPKDKNKPKQSPSSYLLYTNEVRVSFRSKHATKSITEIAKLIGAQWKSMNDEEKKPYKDKAELLRKEYQQKLARYKNTQHYNDYQQQLQQWQETQASNKKKKVIAQKQSNESNKNHNDKEPDGNLSDSSLSSNISDLDIIFSSNNINHNGRAIESSSSELSEEFEGIDFVQHLQQTQESKEKARRQTELNVMSIAECVMNNTNLIEMPSTVKARTVQKDDSQSASDNDEKDGDEATEEREDIMKCRMCFKEFEDENELTQHEKQLHTKQCAQCESKFRTETELEMHRFAKHDVFGTDALKHDDHMRIDEKGNFKMNRSISTQRFIYNHSRVKQRQRMRQQMVKIKNRVVLDKKTALKRKKRGRITVQSYLKTKRSNLGHNKPWSAKETRRFYQCLKYSGLNFLFMEVLYNRAISNEEYAKQAEVARDEDESVGNESDNEVDEKKKKKWFYRDAKALRKKYSREEKKNKEQITRIVNNAKFTMEISCKIDEIVKKNQFKIKDEDYREDSDIEINKKEENKEDANEIEEEDVFDPLLAFKDEIEEDMREKLEMKKQKNEELRAWRMKEEIVAQEKLRKFKQEYEEYQKIKAKGLSVEQVANNNGNIINVIEEDRKENDDDDDDDNDDNAENINYHDDDGENVEGFDPFATLSDHDSDDDVNGHDSDRSVAKKKENGHKINYNMRDIDNEYEFDDDYDDYQNDGMHDFDIDADPFA